MFCRRKTSSILTDSGLGMFTDEVRTCIKGRRNFFFQVARINFFFFSTEGYFSIGLETVLVLMSVVTNAFQTCQQVLCCNIYAFITW